MIWLTFEPLLGLFVLSILKVLSSRHEDRAGTPTIDEPGMGVTVVAPNAVYPGSGPPYSNAPPSSSMAPVMGLPQASVLQVDITMFMLNL